MFLLSLSLYQCSIHIQLSATICNSQQFTVSLMDFSKYTHVYPFLFFSPIYFSLKAFPLPSPFSFTLHVPSLHLPFLFDPFFLTYSYPFILITCLLLILRFLISLSPLDLFDNHNGTQPIISEAHTATTNCTASAS